MENNIKVKIIDETEKAVKVLNEYRESLKADIDCLSHSQREIFKNLHQFIWLPKSQIKVENGYVVYMPTWLAIQNNFVTSDMEKAQEERFNKAVDKYNKALDFAKSHGLKVRARMKLATILETIKNAGLAFEF